jgi:hypothetical protein
MTRHLSPVELVDHLDGRLSASRAAHLEHCDECRREAESLRAIVREATAVDVPEPSSLVWSSMAAEIRRQLAAEQLDPAHRPVRTALDWRLATATVACVLAVLGGLRVLQLPGTNVPSARTAAGAAPSTVASAPTEQASSAAVDREWQVVLDATAELEWPAVGDPGWLVGPGTVEAAALRLPPDEQREVMRLLEEALATAAAEPRGL